ncbi:hypothetical protein [Streptomyces sp. NPDC001380]|uniref:baeRF2 domain-containing protein n=1 Tax=Streptomyces sp. NPDC001380 TaxID=3364566 RepID=UPI0036B1C355
MKLTFLSPLYARQGPFACAYLDTSRDIEDPERAIGLRWRHLRDDLAAQGADMATTGALAHVVGTDRDVSGRHGQAVFAAHGRLALTEELPEPPARDTARYTMLPDALPLALQHAPDIPYAAVAVRRAEREADTGTSSRESPHDLDVEVQVGRWPATRAAGGGRVRRRIPAGEWRQAAARLAEELTGLADRGDAEALVVAADPWVRGVLVRELPRRLRDRVVGLQDAGAGSGPGRALLEEELGYVFRGRMPGRDRDRVDRFLSQRARGRGAEEGLAAAVGALRAGRAESLLVNDPPDLPGTLWVGMAPRQVALTAGELHEAGVQSCWEEPAGAALIRAVVGTGAELVVVDREELPLDDGLGVLLRYPHPVD